MLVDVTCVWPHPVCHPITPFPKTSSPRYTSWHNLHGTFRRSKSWRIKYQSSPIITLPAWSVCLCSPGLSAKGAADIESTSATSTGCTMSFHYSIRAIISTWFLPTYSTYRIFQKNAFLIAPPNLQKSSGNQKNFTTFNLTRLSNQKTSDSPWFASSDWSHPSHWQIINKTQNRVRCRYPKPTPFNPTPINQPTN